MNDQTVRQIEQITDHHFQDTSLLERAFLHSSAVENRTHSNERLEFLGDAILGMVICQRLFERFPDYLEGDLTKIKSMLVSRRTCAKVTKTLGLSEFLNVGKGMTASRALTGSIAAGLLEAVIAAIYIDGGFDAAAKFIRMAFAPLIDQADAEQTQGNFKSVLQQHTQQNLNTTPNYVLLDEKGPDHNKCFEIQVVISGTEYPSAWGTNKKDAEQKAAYNALTELGMVKHEKFEHEHED